MFNLDFNKYLEDKIKTSEMTKIPNEEWYMGKWMKKEMLAVEDIDANIDLDAMIEKSRELVELDLAFEILDRKYETNLDILANNQQVLGFEDVDDIDWVKLGKKVFYKLVDIIIKSLELLADLLVKIVTILFRLATGKTVLLSSIEKKISNLKYSDSPLTSFTEKDIKTLRRKLTGVYILGGEISDIGLSRFFNVIRGLDVKEYNNIVLLANIEDTNSFLKEKVKSIASKFLKVNLSDKKAIPRDQNDLIDYYEMFFIHGYYNKRIGLPIVDQYLNQRLDPNYDHRINILFIKPDKVVLADRMYKNPEMKNVILELSNRKNDDNISFILERLPSIYKLIKYSKLEFNDKNVDTNNVPIKVLSVSAMENIVRELKINSKYMALILKENKKKLKTFKDFIYELKVQASSLEGKKAEAYKLMLNVLLRTEFKFINDSFSGLIKTVQTFNNYSIYDYLDANIKLYERKENDK